MQLQGKLSVERMCELAKVSRAGFYRSLEEKAPRAEESEIRSMVQQIALEHRRRLGSPRMKRELKKRGMVVNHKRIERIMRQDNLLAIRWRKFVVTSESQPGQTVYFNLASRMQATAINQLWVADITYIRLRDEFVFLAVVLDIFSRRVVGWALERTLQARLPVAALESAIKSRKPAAGLVHHSDRGTQYACSEYSDVLTRHAMLPSMSRARCPWDNAACESWIKTLKQEEIYASQYRDMEDLREHLQEFIDNYYNRLRLHSALGYQSPEEFEKTAAGQIATPKVDPRAAVLSFPRHGRSINPIWEDQKGKKKQQER